MANSVCRRRPQGQQVWTERGKAPNTTNLERHLDIHKGYLAQTK